MLNKIYQLMNPGGENEKRGAIKTQEQETHALFDLTTLVDAIVGVVDLAYNYLFTL